MNGGYKRTFFFCGVVAKRKFGRKCFLIRGGALRSLAVLSLVAFLVIVATMVYPLYFKPNITKAIADDLVSSSLTFNSIRGVASVNINVSSPNGSFATSDDGQRASFSISTNNYTGYTLAIRSDSQSTDLTDGVNKLSSISDAVSYDDFNDSGNIGRSLNNKWGYSLNYYRDGDVDIFNSNIYLPAPTSVATILRVTDSANSSDGVKNADIYTIGLGVRADYTNPSGVYTFSGNGDGATFVLEYVANPVNYTVNYVDNTGDATVTGLPETQVGNTYGSSVEISNTIPMRVGFEFIGWCTVEPVASNNTTECVDSSGVAGVIYSSGDLYDISQIAMNNMVLYALWNVEEHNIKPVIDETKDKEEAILRDEADIQVEKGKKIEVEIVEDYEGVGVEGEDGESVKLCSNHAKVDSCKGKK